MNFLGQNLRLLRKEKSLTQEQLAGKIGIKRSLIGAYEEGRTEPKLQTILNICHYFNVSIDMLINKDMSKEEKIVQPDIKGQQLRILPIAVNKHDEKELCTIVPVKASAGYTKGYGDVDFIESLPKFNFPYPDLPADRTYRLFQITGESMLPVLPGSYIICEYVQDWFNIKNEKCYVLVTKDEGIVYKRIINNLNHKELLLKSDNPEFKPYILKTDQLVEVWEAKGYTSFDLPGSEPPQVNISELAGTIYELKKDVEQLKKKLIDDTE
ncbi:MAG: LexA family transcriptional regulator [Chlorobi bacterium]|nr:LexA family transcriptional regulator [Chlorobiota bacterium]